MEATVTDFLLSDFFDPIDIVFARNFTINDTSTTCALAFLMHAARDGHLCVTIEKKSLLPPLPEEHRTHTTAIIDGFAAIPTSTITAIDNTYSPCPTTPVCKAGNRYYLQRFWVYEITILRELQRITNQKPRHTLSLPPLPNTLTPEQRLAITAPLDQCLTILTGGPGTGKTHVAKQIVECYRELSIATAAPTGKAAANLSSGTNNTPAQTLHALLGIKPNNTRISHKKLAADLIIVDESSMIDVRIMAKLLSAIKDGARLILIGDKHQLPPVEAGALFANLTARYANTPHLISLTTPLRTDIVDIINLSNAINQADPIQTLHILNNSSSITFSTLPERISDAHETIIAYALSHLPHPDIVNTTPTDKLLPIFNSFRILSPLRKGLLGVDELNTILHKHCNYKKNTPIMITKNSPSINCTNGEVGILNRDGFAIFPGGNASQRFYDPAINARKIPAPLLPHYEYAYCISIHKSQGSEFDHIALILPPGSEIFGKEALYTAVTRARSHIHLLAHNTTITNTITAPLFRNSGIVGDSVPHTPCQRT